MALSGDELRAITGYAARCARQVLDLFETARPDDPRPREAGSRPAAAQAALAAGDDHDVGDTRLEWAASRAPAPVIDVLARTPPAPTGRTRAAALLTPLDAQLRR